MSDKPRNGGSEAAKKMTRGEFLGVGAVAAAGVAAGCTQQELALTAVGLTAGYMARPTSCSGCSGDFSWAIPAGILNILWGDVLPRLIAREWRLGTTRLKPGMDSADLRYEVQQLRASVVADPQASDVLKQRMLKVEAYLYRQGAIPFLIPAEGGFDFLLSDWGMEFFPPKMPKTEAAKRTALLRYYTFRRTGRPSLGLPFYLTDPDSAISTDSPTGPSQIQVRSDLPSLEGFAPECNEIIASIRAKMSNHQAERTISLEEYKCLMSPLRCWQVEGSVYRAVATEAPRVVATIWTEMDDLDYLTRGCPSDQVCLEQAAKTRPDSYWARFDNPNDDGLRLIFEERLETMLPPLAIMRFEVGRPPDWPSSGLTFVDGDMMLSSRGFFFPVLPPLPTLQALLFEIEEGKAGNPVFTDSKRTQQ